jgi:uncharacterized protein (DUF58 family)
MPLSAHSADSPRRFRSAVSHWAAGVDRPAWRRFFLALFALTFALFLALYATALRQSGQYMLAATVAALSLFLAALVATRIVPRLARRTVLRHWLAKVEYEFTREGAVYLAMVTVIAIAALNTGNNLLYIILSCLLAGILASGVLSGIVLQGFELKIGLPDPVFAEQPVTARLGLTNLKPLAPTFSVTVSGGSPSRRKRARQKEPSRAVIFTQAVYIPYIPHRASTAQNVQLTFPARGRYLQESLRVSTRFPFGLLRKTRSIPCRQEVLVLPNVQPTKKFPEVLPPIGNEMDSYLKGRSHDLYAIRNYQESDSARHVDWKATARVQRLKVREFTREDERRLELVFDRRIPDNQPQTIARFEKAVTLCACLAWYFYETGTTMQFTTDGFETPMSPAAQILYPILEKLALIEPVVTAGRLLNHFAAGSSARAQGFQIVLTHQPPESIPASQRQLSSFVFMDSL